jgi:hypothetical protein
MSSVCVFMTQRDERLPPLLWLTLAHLFVICSIIVLALAFRTFVFLGEICGLLMRGGKKGIYIPRFDSAWDNIRKDTF